MIAHVVRALVAAGATPDMILAAVEAAEAERCSVEENRKRKNRERMQAVRERARTDMHVQAHLPDKERSPTPPKEINPPPSLRSGEHSARETPAGTLAEVLDDERARAVVDHRQRIRKPLTPHAAKLLAGKFAQCPDPNAAADVMIANGWQGFEPKWLDSRSTGPPRQRAVNGFAAFALDLAEQDHDAGTRTDPDPPGRPAAPRPGAERGNAQPRVLDTERPERAGGPYTVAGRG